MNAFEEWEHKLYNYRGQLYENHLMHRADNDGRCVHSTAECERFEDEDFTLRIIFPEEDARMDWGELMANLEIDPDGTIALLKRVAKEPV